MKVIVLGGAGFIGSNLSEYLLKKKYEVIVIDNLSTGRLENILNIKKNVKFIKADISKKGLWVNHFKGVKYVFHLAALQILCLALIIQLNIIIPMLLGH